MRFKWTFYYIDLTHFDFNLRTSVDSYSPLETTGHISEVLPAQRVYNSVIVYK